MIQILGLRDDVVEGCYYVEKRPRIALRAVVEMDAGRNPDAL